MFKTFSWLLLLCLGAHHLPATAEAEADGPDFYRVTGVAADDVLNIRAEPSPHATHVGSIPPMRTACATSAVREG